MNGVNVERSKFSSDFRRALYMEHLGIRNESEVIDPFEIEKRMK